MSTVLAYRKALLLLGGWERVEREREREKEGRGRTKKKTLSLMSAFLVLSPEDGDMGIWGYGDMRRVGGLSASLSY